MEYVFAGIPRTKEEIGTYSRRLLRQPRLHQNPQHASLLQHGRAPDRDLPDPDLVPRRVVPELDLLDAELVHRVGRLARLRVGRGPEVGQVEVPLLELEDGDPVLHAADDAAGPDGAPGALHQERVDGGLVGAVVGGALRGGDGGEGEGEGPGCGAEEDHCDGGGGGGENVGVGRDGGGLGGEGWCFIRVHERGRASKRRSFGRALVELGAWGKGVGVKTTTRPGNEWPRR